MLAQKYRSRGNGPVSGGELPLVRRRASNFGVIMRHHDYYEPVSLTVQTTSMAAGSPEIRRAHLLNLQNKRTESKFK